MRYLLLTMALALLASAYLSGRKEERLEAARPRLCDGSAPGTICSYGCRDAAEFRYRPHECSGDEGGPVYSVDADGRVRELR